MAETLNINLAVIDKATAPLKAAGNQVNQFSAQTSKATRSLNQYGKQADGATRFTKKFAMSGLQQAGYQVGDFAVQVGAGTSKLQAFGQQGSQLLGIFGPVGAVLGAGVAIVAALGNAFFKAKEQASGLTNTTNALNTAFAKTKSIGKDLEKQYGMVTAEVLALTTAQKALAIQRQVQAFTAAKNALSVFADEIDETKSRMGPALFLSPVENFRNVFIQSFADIQEQLGTKSIPAITKLGETLRAVATAEGAPQIIEAVRQATEQLTRMGASGEKVEELTELLATLAKTADDVEGSFTEMSGSFMPDNFSEAMRFHEQAIKGIDDKMKALKDTTKDVSDAMGSAFGAAFKDIIMGTKNVNEAFSNMAGRIIERLFDIIVIESLVKSISGSGPMQSIAKFFSGARATGGPVTTGKTYMVGEKGPELFTAGTSGRIIPNNQMGGGVVVHQNINLTAGVSGTVRAEVMSMLPMIREASKSAVLEASRRGGSFANTLGK